MIVITFRLPSFEGRTERFLGVMALERTNFSAVRCKVNGVASLLALRAMETSVAVACRLAFASVGGVGFDLRWAGSGQQLLQPFPKLSPFFIRLLSRATAALSYRC